MHSYTQTVNGFGGSRRLSAEIIAFQDRFNVPPKLDMLGRRHGQVLAGFKEAARYMGLPARVIQAVDYLFRFTRVEDWIGDAKPIVWPSNREMGEALGLTLSGIKKLNRRLIELGFVTAKDSPTGVRWGRRGHNGQILVAYGFDLSPLALRAEEFADLRDAGRADDAARADLRRRKTIALRSIGQLVRTAIEQGFDTAELLVPTRRARSPLSRTIRAALWPMAGMSRPSKRSTKPSKPFLTPWCSLPPRPPRQPNWALRTVNRPPRVPSKAPAITTTNKLTILWIV
jgi:replication initiation protein RepC